MSFKLENSAIQIVISGISFGGCKIISNTYCKINIKFSMNIFRLMKIWRFGIIFLYYYMVKSELHAAKVEILFGSQTQKPFWITFKEILSLP